MKKLVAFFVDRSLVVNLITVGVIAFGVIVAGNINRVLLPPMQPRTITVSAALPGASAVDMERFVTFRLEEALKGMRGIEKVISTTQNGRATIQILMLPEVEDLTKPLEETRSRLMAIQHRLPPDLRPLKIREQQNESATILMEIFIEQVDERDVKHREAIRAFSEKIERMPAILSADSSLRDMDLYVRFSRTALDKAGLSVTVARARILEALQHLPVGAVTVRDQDVAIELSRLSGDVRKKLLALPLQMNRLGRGVRLGDVAKVDYEFEERRWRRTKDGRTYVELAVFTTLGADIVDASKQVRGAIEAEAKKILPKPMVATINVDLSEAIKHEMDTLQGNGLSGIVIVIVILMAFLGWRVSAMTALGLPFCYLGMVLVLQYFGITFNLISLIAMILVVGILVDDAIIVSEEYCQQLGQGKTGRDAAIGAVSRVAKPVIGMVATTTVAFLPLVVLKGGESWFIRPLPIVVIAALFLSLFESFFLLPNHLRHLMPSGGKLRDRRIVIWIRERYRGLLHWTLKLRYVAVLVVFGLAAVAVILVMGPVKMKAGFQLSAAARIFIELPKAATSLDELGRQVAPVEALVKTLPKDLVRFHTVQLGKTYALVGNGHMRGWKYAQIAIVPPGSFVDQEEGRHKISALLRDKLPALKKKHGFAKLLLFKDARGETRDVVTVYVSGGDRIAFDEIQGKIRSNLKAVDEVKDVFMDDARFQRALSFDADDAKVLAYELTKRNLYAQLREHFSQQELLRFRHSGEELEVFLGFQGKQQPSVEALSKLTVISGRGVPVPLSLLGKWKQSDILRRIEHQDMLRMFQIDVLYDPAKVKAKKVAEAIEKQLEPLRQAYPGYHISVKPSEAVQKSKEWMTKLVMICVGLIYLCLALSLGSLVQPILVLFAIPFGFIGVVLAFYFHGLPLEIMAIIGVLGLAGVVVNDSLVMTSTINDAFRNDPAAGFRAAVLTGAAGRFRAVVLTSLTTLGGVFPLAYGFAGEAGWLRPMVLAVGWGLLFATILTLFFIPCLLMIVDDIRRIGRWIRGLFRRKQPPELKASDEVVTDGADA